jgi:hypothetical protein
MDKQQTKWQFKISEEKSTIDLPKMKKYKWQALRYGRKEYFLPLASGCETCSYFPASIIVFSCSYLFAWLFTCSCSCYLVGLIVKLVRPETLTSLIFKTSLNIAPCACLICVQDKQAFAEILKRISKIQKTNGSSYVILRGK